MRPNHKDALSTKELYSLPTNKPGGGKTIKVTKIKQSKKGKKGTQYGTGGYGNVTSTK